jgi:virginiamycin B lyase
MRNIFVVLFCASLLSGCGLGAAFHWPAATQSALSYPDAHAHTGKRSITVYPIPSGASPFGIVRGPDGNMWFTEQFPSGSIGRVTPSGVVTEFRVSKSGDEKCIIAGRGVLWFASNQSRLIGKISTSGHATTYTAPGIAPYCVALGSDANVWFTDTANVAIGRLNAISGHIVEFKLANSSSVPLEIAKGRDGNVWFSDGGLGMVGKVTPTGSITEYALPSGSSSSPYGIAEGPDGAIYVGEVLAGNIARVTTAGAITEYHVGTVSPAALSQGPDRQIWFTGSTATSPDGIERFIVATHKVQPIAIPPNGARALATAPGPDSDVWFTAEGQSANQNYIGLLEY